MTNPISDSSAPLISNRFRVVEVQRDVKEGAPVLIVECPLVGGGDRRFALGSEMLSSTKAYDHLRAQDQVLVPDASTIRHELERAWTDPDLMSNVSRNAGWVGDDFVLPDRVIGENAKSMKYVAADGEPVAFDRSSLKAWRKAFEPLVPQSNVLVALVSAAFVGPLIHKLGRSGFPLLHIVGGTPRERLLAARTAIAVAGPSAESDLLPLGTSLEVLRSALLRRRDQIAGLVTGRAMTTIADRRKALQATALGALLGTIAKTEGAQPGTMRLTAVSVDRHDEDAGLGIGAPTFCLVPLHPRRGLWDQRRDDAPSAEELSTALELALAENGGGPYPKFLSKLQAADDVIELVKEREERFAAKVKAKINKPAAVQLEACSAIYAAGCLAVDWKIVPWTRRDVFSAAMRMMTRASTVGASIPDIAEQALRKVLVHRNEEAKFPFLKADDKLAKALRSRCWGIRRRVRGTKILALFRDRLDLVISANVQADVLKAWRASGILLPGRDAEHHAKRLTIRGLSPSEVQCLRFDWEQLEKLAKQRGLD